MVESGNNRIKSTEGEKTIGYRAEQEKVYKNGNPSCITHLSTNERENIYHCFVRRKMKRYMEKLESIKKRSQKDPNIKLRKKLEIIIKKVMKKNKHPSERTPTYSVKDKEKKLDSLECEISTENFFSMENHEGDNKKPVKIHGARALVLGTNENDKTVREKRKYRIMCNREMLSFLSLREIEFETLPENPRKLAEASFSEVFVVNGLVYKIIPLNEEYSSEQFCKELSIMKIMSEEEGIAGYKDAFFVTGKYKKCYVDAWKKYKNTENKDPSGYSTSQRYGCIVMNNYGIELEKYKFKSGKEIVIFLMRLSELLGRLEEKYEFEHRDMHWGNVLVKDGYPILIDFSLSRACIVNGTECLVVYTDLNKEEWLFTGDSNVDPQFSVYRKMKEMLNGNWEIFGGSNLLWYMYIVEKLWKKTIGFGQKTREMVKRIRKRICAMYRRWKSVSCACKWMESQGLEGLMKTKKNI